MSEIKTWREVWAEDKKQHGFGASSQLSFADREIDELRAALADAERDAGYYRKLRNGEIDNYSVADFSGGAFNGELYGSALDQAMQIDDAKLTQKSPVCQNHHIA